MVYESIGNRFAGHLLPNIPDVGNTVSSPEIIGRKYQLIENTFVAAIIGYC